MRVPVVETRHCLVSTVEVTTDACSKDLVVCAAPTSVSANSVFGL